MVTFRGFGMERFAMPDMITRIHFLAGAFRYTVDVRVFYVPTSYYICSR